MASASGITVPVKADPRGLVDFARAVVTHMTALADELEQIAAPAPELVHYSPAGDGETACGQWLFAASDDLLAATCGPCKASDAYRDEMRAFRDWRRERRAVA